MATVWYMYVSYTVAIVALGQTDRSEAPTGPLTTNRTEMNKVDSMYLFGGFRNNWVALVFISGVFEQGDRTLTLNRPHFSKFSCKEL